MSEKIELSFRDKIRLAVGAGGVVVDAVIAGGLMTESIQHSPITRAALGVGMVAAGQALPVLERIAGLNILAPSAGNALRNGK